MRRCGSEGGLGTGLGGGLTDGSMSTLGGGISQGESLDGQFGFFPFDFTFPFALVCFFF